MRTWRALPYLVFGLVALMAFPRVVAAKKDRKRGQDTQATQTTFRYEELPDIPVLGRSEDAFALNLRNACRAVDAGKKHLASRPEVRAENPGNRSVLTGEGFDEVLNELSSLLDPEAGEIGEHRRKVATLEARIAVLRVELAGLQDRDRNSKQAELDRLNSELTNERRELEEAGESHAKARGQAIAKLVMTMERVAEVCEHLENKEPTEPDLEFLRGLRDAERFAAFVDLLERGKTRSLEGGELRGAGVATSAVALEGIANKAINGLADFVVKRAKEEAILAIQERIKEKLCDEDREIHFFISETCKVLESLDASISLRAIGTQLHAAAVADLERLPDVVLAYLAHEQPKTNELVFAGRLAYASFLEVRGGREPVDVLAAIHAVSKLPCEENQGASSCSEEAKALRQISATLYVAWNDEIMKLVGGTKAAEAPVVVTGLWLMSEARAEGTEWADAYSFERYEKLLQVTSRLWSVAHRVMEIKKTIASFEAPEDPEARRAAQRAMLADVLGQVALVGDEVIELLIAAEIITGEEMTEQARKVSKSFGLTVEVTSELLVEDWGGATLATTKLLDELCTGEVCKIDSDLFAIVPLLVEIANADSSTEVAAAIEAAAAPAGSYRSKYQHWAVSLNAFVGGGGGGEWLSSGSTSGWSGIGTGFAPVGIHVSAPFGFRAKKNRYTMHGGAMVSVLDIGALTTYRAQRELDDAEGGTAETNNMPEVGFAQVFSPGLFAVLGVGHLPLVIGGGFSMTPKLREITDSNADVRDAAALRVLAFIAIDVTLFQFR